MPGSLILGRDELVALRGRLDRYHWYRSAFEGFRARVEELAMRRPAVPVAKGRAFFESCENCATRLTFDPYDQSSHRCPKCGREHHGEAFDLAWLRQFHDWLGKRLVEAGIVYRVDGDERHAELVRHYLSHYVAHYRDYPLANNLLGPTRLFQSTYLEAFWLVDMVAAFDLTRDSPAYSPLDLNGVRDLLYESASVVRSYDEGRSNRQAFNNAGMGAVGLLYEDDELISHVLTGPHGFEFHMRESVLEDGVWYEGENYHYATLDHTLNLAEMARHRGIDLYSGGSGHGSLKPMFDGPLKVMLPDLTFPSRKDSWFGRGMEFHRHVYELGYARYGDVRYGGLLADAYASGIHRGDMSWRTFLYLEPELPPVGSSVRPTGNESMPGTGVAVLRSDDGADYASLEYGHYGGGHGHPDRLHLTLFAGGVHWLLDPGTGWYHVPELGWYRSTIAHNTVTIDGKNQPPREGRLVAFGSAGGFSAAQATVEGIGPGLAARRSLVLGDGFLFDVLDLLPDDEKGQRQVDWSFHTVGRFEQSREDADAGQTVSEGDAGATAEAIGTGNGYEFLSGVREVRAESGVDVTARSGDVALRMVQPGRVDAAFVARAPGVPGNEEWPLSSLVARREIRGPRRIATAWLWSADSSAARFGQDGDHHVLELGARRHTFYVAPFDDVGQAGVAVFTRNAASAAVGDEAVATTLAWFGLRALSLPEVGMTADRVLPQGAVKKSGIRWRPELSGDFGVVELTPGGEEPLRYEQGPGVAIWLDDDELSFFAGVTNEFRLHLGWYGRAPERPEVLLPAGWRLERLEEAHTPGTADRVATWSVELRPPSGREAGGETVEADHPSEGGVGHDLIVRVAGKREVLRYTVAAPLEGGWRVGVHHGAPAALLSVSDRLGVGGELAYVLDAPWLDVPLSGSARVDPGRGALLALPIPLTEPAPAGSGPRGTWPVSARLHLGEAGATFAADLPLVWAGARAGKLQLEDESQALWADRRWGGPEDVRAEASVSLGGSGVSLSVRVWDDVHVVDANDHDLYENDSVQVYLDFRGEGRGDRNFTPGVAAYVLAPDAAKENVTVKQIAGNREISNRGARARWFTVYGVDARCQPAESGYVLDVHLPYESMGVAPPRAGDVIGVDLSVSDNDGTWYRNTQMLWSGSRGRRCYIRGSYHDPGEFGALIVSADPETG